MSEGYSEVTSKGWFERIIESIKGVLVGLVLFVIAFPLLFWNEGRAVETYLGIKEGEGSIVEAAPDKVDSANQDKLVHLTGLATTTETLRDPDFGVDINAVRLQRKSEIYQWVETIKSKTRKKLGGGEETVKTPEYAQEWVTEAIDSSKFKDRDGHQNVGPYDFPSRSWMAAKTTLGAFTLPSDLVGQIDSFEPVPPENIDLQKGMDTVKAKWKTSGDWLYRGANASTPAIGDMRIKFAAVKPTTVSLYAQQANDTFRAYPTKVGTKLERIQVGNFSAKQMLDSAQDENVKLTWILRGVGLFLMWMGITLIFKPLVVIADVVPFIGNVLQMGIGLFAALLALPLALITIALGWIYYRPVLGVSLLAAAAVVLGLMFYLGRKRAKPAKA